MMFHPSKLSLHKARSLEEDKDAILVLDVFGRLISSTILENYTGTCRS